MSEDQVEPPSIALLVEAEADARTAATLIDGQLRQAADWLADAELDHYRRWTTIHWQNVPKLCREHGVVAQGKFNGEPGAPDAHAARRSLLLLSKLGAPAAVVLLRDADNQPERLRGLGQARDSSRHIDPARVAIGVAKPTREAWHLVGFVAQSAEETATLERERRRLGLDPSRHPHKLARKGERAIKPVLSELTRDEPERLRQCFAHPPEQLRERGTDCGLSEFLDEIDARVVPAIR